MVRMGIFWDGPIQSETGTVQLRNRGRRVRILPGSPITYRMIKASGSFSARLAVLPKTRNCQRIGTSLVQLSCISCVAEFYDLNPPIRRNLDKESGRPIGWPLHIHPETSLSAGGAHLQRTRMDPALSTTLTGPEPTSGSLIWPDAYARARSTSERPISLSV